MTITIFRNNDSSGNVSLDGFKTQVSCIYFYFFEKKVYMEKYVENYLVHPLTTLFL